MFFFVRNIELYRWSLNCVWVELTAKRFSFYFFTRKRYETGRRSSPTCNLRWVLYSIVRRKLREDITLAQPLSELALFVSREKASFHFRLFFRAHQTCTFLATSRITHGFTTCSHCRGAPVALPLLHTVQRMSPPLVALT